MIVDVVRVLSTCLTWLLNLEVAGVHVFKVAMAILAVSVGIGCLRLFVGVRDFFTNL